jgi:integrase
MAYLRRFKDSRYWFACFKGVNGKRLQRSTKETDRRLAQKIADRYEGTAAQASLGFLVERQARKVIGEIYEISTREKLRSDSVQDFFTRWLERVHVELNHKTFKRYEGVTGEFLNWLGPRASLSIAHLSSVDIVGYRDYLARKHSPSSVNISLAAIQSALGRAFDDRLVDVNEASRVPRLKDDPARKQQRRAFTERELQAILKVCDPEWRGMVLCGAYSGMRLGDVSLLRWENVDLAGRELHFKTEKTRREQTIPIAEPLLRHLMEIAGSDDPRAPLFPRAFAGRQRKVLTGALSNQFYRLMSKAGVVPPRTNESKGKGRNAARTSVGLGYHCLRHSVTTMLKQAGASDVVAREIVGHDSAAVSRTYSHIDTQTLRAAIDRLPDITGE